MKHQAWRHDPAAYGPPQPVVARWADVDTRRHINNIAVYALHQEARQRWLMQAGGDAVWPQALWRLKPQHTCTEFWREAHYPAPLAAQVRLCDAGPAGLSLATGLFQAGACAGVQQTTMAAWAPGFGSTQPLPAEWLATLQAQPVEQHPPHGQPQGLGELAHYPVQCTYHSRYADHDADGCTSEPATLRGIEQARAAVLQAAYAAAGGDAQRDWVNLVVARIDLHWLHHAPPPAAWAPAGAVAALGRSSCLLRVAMFAGGALQAHADCVMVYTDPAAPSASAALPSALRDALQALAWAGPAHTV
jgi:acyl-CoA thioesterase FadM